MTDLPAEQLVWTLTNMHAVARCLHVVADSGVADALDGQPRPAAELAARTGLDADALHRILRLLAGYGVFAEEPGGFAHTPASRLLRTDHPQSMRPFARMIGLPSIWADITELPHAARAGRPARGMAAHMAHFAENPHEAALFNHAMAAKSAGIIAPILDAYDFSGAATIADIAGGRGHLLDAVLARTPGAAGVLFDLPHVIEDVAAQASDRFQLVAGDFFNDVLPAADHYLLMEVIHDWSDEDAIRILTAVRRAAPPTARLLIIETLVAETPGPHMSTMLDVLMMAITGGRERTPAEYGSLLRQAGFAVQRVIPTKSPYSIVEAVLEST